MRFVPGLHLLGGTAWPQLCSVSEPKGRIIVFPQFGHGIVSVVISIAIAFMPEPPRPGSW